jgi:hypothetical protein
MARMRPRERSSPGCSGAGPLRRARRGGVHPLLRLEDEASPAIDVDPAVSLARPRGPAHRRAAGGRGPAVADGLRVRHAPARRDRRRSARKALPVPVAAGLRPRRRQGAARRPGPRRLQGALAQRRRPRRHDRGQVPRPPRRKRSLRGRMVCVVTRMACAATSGTAQTVKKSAFHAHPARMPRDFRTRPADQILGLNLLSASPEVQPIAAREVRHLPAHVDAGYAANDRRGAGRGAVSGHGGGGGSVLFARAGNGQSRGIGGRS